MLEDQHGKYFWLVRDGDSPARAILPSSCLVAAARGGWGESCAHALAVWIADLAGMIVPEKEVKAEDFSEMLLDGLALNEEDQF